MPRPEMKNSSKITAETPNSPKITILGLGLGGMITALSLAKHNISTHIIEGRAAGGDGFFHDVRTTALTDSSKQFFQQIGVWEKLAELSCPINDIYVADNRAPNLLHFASSELKKGEKMGYLIENTPFKKALFEEVSASSLINIMDDTSYEITENTPDGCSLLLNGKITHKCDLLLVCDGRGSAARRRYFSADLEKSYNQNAITFIAQHEKPHEGSAVEHFLPSGPFAILPLKDQHRSSIVWSVPSDKNDMLMNLPKDELTHLVQRNFGEFLGEVQIKSEIASFPLKAYVTKQYYNKRIALVADTAHIVHPLAGQGLNQGIKDVQALAELLLEHGIAERVLEKYQTMRKADNSNILEITDVINSVFSNDSKLFHSARQLGFAMIESLPPLKNLLIKYAMGRR
ncbi:MAG: 2-octaprenyl-6-methoxyphenyl hydroxylase [Rickettsiales bacterium]|nr:MAG: 2-octaprenyl-6-methoxyphenyl hydroxylase [Rickettsiales bacterium]